MGKIIAMVSQELKVSRGKHEQLRSGKVLGH